MAKIKSDMAQGIDVSDADKKLAKQAVRMQPEDVGKMVFGELDENRLPHPDSPIKRFFTPKKIAHAAESVSRFNVYFELQHFSNWFVFQ